MQNITIFVDNVTGVLVYFERITIFIHVFFSLGLAECEI